MSKQEFSIVLPDVDNADQGKEKVVVTYKGKTKEFITHDYDEIYKIPGLYEHLFYDTLKCDSPNVVCSLLKENLNKSSFDPCDLVVLDVGAGNGMVGEAFVEMGVNTVLGVDIIEEASEAAMRDRPGVYESYYVEDLTQLPDHVESEITGKKPNCLSIVASLGFDDIPALAFASGFNLISEQGWLSYNIKDEFLQKDHPSGFFRLIDQLSDEGVLEIVDKKRYQHRLCIDGTPLNYFAMVGKKQKNISSEILEQYQ